MYKETILNNKLKILSYKIESSFTTNIGIFIKSGTKNELNENYGCAHFLEHMLFKGTKNRTAKDIAEEIDGIGGAINAYTTHEFTTFYTKTLKEEATTAFDVLYDMIANSLLDSEEIEKEKKVILEEINMYEDDPHSFVQEEFSKNLFKNSQLGNSILGEKELVKKIDRQILLDYFKDHYRPDNIIVSITGNFDIELLEQIADRLAKLEVQPEAMAVSEQEKGTRNFGVRTYEKDNISQIYFTIGMEGLGKTHRDFNKLVLLSNLLGGTSSSFLFQEIRENRSLCYDIGCYTTAYRDTGELLISGGANTENFNEALEGIFDIIEDIGNAGVSLEEFNRTKKQIKSHLVMSFENPKNIMFKMAISHIYKDGFQGIENIISDINGITYEMLQEFIHSYLKKERFSACILGPGGTEEIKRKWEEIHG